MLGNAAVPSEMVIRIPNKSLVGELPVASFISQHPLNEQAQRNAAFCERGLFHIHMQKVLLAKVVTSEATDWSY
jgi:hypothetical protein